MPWAPPQPELNNYTKKEGKNRPGSGGDCGQGICTYKDWLAPEELSWICNQSDNCFGFIFDKPRGHGGWVIARSGVRPEVADPRYDVYEKKANNWRKANQPDTNVEGVLPDDQRKTRFRMCQNEGSGDCRADKAVWTGAPLGVFNCGGDKCGNNDVVSYKVPLGFKFMLSDNNIGQNAVEGYWNRGGQGNGGYFVLDQPENHGMRNKIDTGLIQNIGFDIKANWETMVSKGVNVEDAFKIKRNWCRSSVTNINDANCTNFYATPEAAAAGYRYDTDMFELCKADPTWFNKTSCRTAFNNAVKGTTESLRQQAKDKVTAYCDTNAGANQVDGLCGCYNVMKYGNACLGDKAALPGCRELKSTIGDLPAGAQVAFADKFCASDVCVTQALGNAALLPDYTQGKQCPSIAMCVQDFRNASLTNSPVKAECRNTLNITGLPGPAAAAVPPPPPPSGGGAAPPPPPPPSGAGGGGAAPSGAGGGGAAPSGTGGGSAPPSGTGGGAAAPAAAGASAGAAGATSASTGPNKGLIIGASIGGGLLFLICCLIAIFFIMKKKGKSA
jgi:hypothetical protein